jgi:calcium-dependent protein kinase
VIHRDIKPDNIIISGLTEQFRLKVIDFGIAKRLKHDKERIDVKTGTLLFISPEMIRGSHNQASDMWALGVLIFILLSGSPPFFSQNK